MKPAPLVLLLALPLLAQPPDPWAAPSPALPLLHPEPTLTPDAYKKLPLHRLWKSYPVYHPDKAPPDYLQWLASQAPEPLPSPSGLLSDADWIRAGREIFESPVAFHSLAARPATDTPYLTEKEWFDRVNPPLARDGSTPAYHWVVRTRGKVEIGVLSCATCHSRVLPNGAVALGAQGNFPFDAAMAEDLRASVSHTASRAANKALFRRLFFAPWYTGRLASIFDESFDVEYAAKLLSGHNPGSMSPAGAAPWQPVQIPDLAGVASRSYLTRTGLHPNRGLADLMRFLALHQGFGDGSPSARFSEEQLYALARYVASLKPLPSPYKIDKLAKSGEKVFEREGCASCHTPPLYTNNKLAPAEPRPHPDALSAPIGTDPALALQTRHATGFYTVPSLRGLWYRGALEHSGRVTTLEEWFSPTRLEYCKGHEFGLRLNAMDQSALITFLRTL